MKKRIFSFVLAMVMVLTTLVILPVTVSADTWSESGTTHTISTANDLMSFASAVSGGNDFAGHSVVLAEDIDLSGKTWQGIGYAAGQANWKNFSGTFDGQGHKVTNISASAGNNDGLGSFFLSLAGDAVVKNVALYGTIVITRTGTGNSSYFGTVAARVRTGGTVVTIQNVYSAVNLDASHLEDVNPTNCGLYEVGGLVGEVWLNEEVSLTIDGCVYAGTISCNGTGNGGNRPHSFGGLVGVIRTPSSYTHKLYIKDSAFTGTFTAKSMNHFGAFVGKINDEGSSSGKNLVWIDNCYAAGTVSVNPHASGRANYNGYLIGAYGNYLSSPNASGLTGSNATIRAYAQNCYYVSANYTKNANANNTFAQTAATQALSNRSDRANYTEISPSATAAGNTTNTGDYRVSDITFANLCSMTAANTNFSIPSNWYFFSDGEHLPLPAYVYENFYEEPIPEVNDFYIGTATELAAFAADVNGGNTYEGKTVYLTADIAAGDSWTSIGQRTGGNAGTRFQGTFNGQGHTITFSHTVSSSTSGALFGYLGDGAVVKNLKLDGTITVSSTETINFIAPLANCVIHSVSVQNVWSSVTMNAGTNLYYSGGIVGFMENGTYNTVLTIDSCVSDGLINCGNQTKAIGGFVGYTGNIGDVDKALTITNSLWSGQIALNDPSYSTSVGGFVGYQPGGNSNKTVITISDSVSAGKITFNTENDWSGHDRWIAMVVAAGCVDVSGGVAANDSRRNCPIILTNVYYRQLKDWAGNDIARNNICDDPGTGKYTAPVYTNSVQMTMEELAALTGSAFTDSAKWNAGSETELPCPASIVTAFGRPESTQGVVEESTEIEIGTAEELAAFAAAVNGGDNFEGKTVLLTADIAAGESFVTIGSRTSKPFRGTFDGQGHTVTFSHAVSSSTTGALFGYLGAGAVVQNLKLDGTITINAPGTTINFIAALANAVVGAVSIQNVWSSVAINASCNLYYSSDFVGFLENNAAVTLTIDSCVSDGLINCGQQAKAIGAFVGYTGNTGGSNKTLTITNSVWNGMISLNDPGYSTIIGGFVGYQKSSNGTNYTSITIANCIAAGKMTFNSESDWSGRQRLVAMVVGSSCMDTTGGVNGDDSNMNCPLTLTNVFYRNLTDWEGNDIVRNNMCSNPATAPVYTNAEQKTTAQLLALSTSSFANAGKWNGGATTQIPCPASIVTTFGYPASLTKDAYDSFDTFEIGTADALIAIATAVNEGGKTYAGKTVILTADINLASADWISIGNRSAGNAFRGTFNGGGYTISNMTATANDSATGALFGYLGSGAVIENFTLTGTVTATVNANFLATVANSVYGTVSILNVRSSVKLTQNSNGMQIYYTGGIVGFMDNNKATNLTVDGCVFDGTINCGGQTHYVAGIIGYTGHNVSGAKSLTVTNTAFSGQINLNDPGYFPGNSCFIGYVKKDEAGISVTVSDCVSTGRISYTKAQEWPSDNCYSYNGVLLGEIEEGAALSVARFYYVPVTVSGESELAVIGKQGETYGATNAGAVKKSVEEMAALTGAAFSDASKWKFTADESFVLYFPCPASFPAIAVSKVLEQAKVTVEARNTNDVYKGIRFIGTFYNTAACHNAGTQGADFGLLIISSDLYNSDLNTAEALVAAGAKVAKAVKYKVEGGAYVIHAVVYGIPDGCKDVSLVAVPYMDGYLGKETAPISYNTVFN